MGGEFLLERFHSRQMSHFVLRSGLRPAIHAGEFGPSRNRQYRRKFTDDGMNQRVVVLVDRRR
jgi:hypothetical protein